MMREEGGAVRSPSTWRVILLLALLVGVFAPVLTERRDPETELASIDVARRIPVRAEPTEGRHEGVRVDPLDLVVIPDDLGWAPLLAAPVASRFRHPAGDPPLLIALSTERGETLQTLMGDLEPRRSLQIGVIEPMCDGSVSTERFAIPAEPYLAAVAVAKRFWATISEVIVAPLDEPSLLVLGSALASHSGVPFVPLGAKGEKRLFLDLAEYQSVRVILLSESREESIAGEHPEEGFEIVRVGRQEAERRLTRSIGAASVNNVLLARVPRQSDISTGAVTWLAPYLSLVRRAPIVLVRSADGLRAEEQVHQLVETFSLRPRTVTILGGEDSIGVISVFDERLRDYMVEIEPCSGSGRGTIAAYGVGRIPWEDQSRASLLFARGLIWQSRMASRLPSVLMLANPETEYGVLPLCETISRAAAQEFKNKGATVIESYGEDLTDPLIAEAASTVNLLFFHGHVTDLLLFGSQDFEGWEGVVSDHESQSGNGPFDDEDVAQGHDDENEILPETFAEMLTPVGGSQFDMTRHFSRVDDLEDEVIFPQVRQLSGAPVVFLQSCHSLPGLGPLALGLGAVGVIGSTTNIHSASGGAFAKAFGDSMLYEGSTLGEALRDARNYFLCLLDLKESRGHRELAKVYRVALSFRLLGDPELAFAALSAQKPRRRRVSARLYRTGRIAFRMPSRRFPRIETDDYFVRMFPGSQLAGIVKRLKHRPVRRILPLYYARVPTREDSPLLRDSASREATIRVDPHGRFVYVLSLPDRLSSKEKLKIRRDATAARRQQRI